MPRHSIGVIPIENGLRAFTLHPGVPTFTVVEYRSAHQSGRFGCGSCGELMPPGHGFEYLERDYKPDTVITIQLQHNFYLDDERPEDYVPAAEAPPPIHAILYEEGTRKTYVLNGDGRHERLFGIVYREAAAPERPYREIWYPTCDIRTPEETKMPRHEFIVKRLPQERTSERGYVYMSKLTVAAFRSHYGRQIKCFACDELHDVSVLDRVWEEWGPDAVITIDHNWVREPNDPLNLRPTRTRYLQGERPRDDGEDCASPDPGGR